MAYNELVKNFERIRSYMRDFYIYGFKSRSEYDAKSARSYDDERRRIESWLGGYMSFTRTSDGKNVFLSVNSRTVQHNPFYKAWKAKSFTDGDITLHFIIFDILYEPSVKKTIRELIDTIDFEYLNKFEAPMSFDESTVRKKLKEYISEGLIIAEKQGRQTLYRRAESSDISALGDTLDYFSETAPCGVIGSFLLDKLRAHDSVFTFKHHYITQTMDSDVLAQLFTAMHSKHRISADNYGKRSEKPKTLYLIPLKIYISAQSGRQYLIAYCESANRINSYRLDYLSAIKDMGACARFDKLRNTLGELEKYMWGVKCRFDTEQLEHIEFTVYVGDGEDFIVKRLEREKRCGTVEKLDDTHYRFTADVFDTMEAVPWIRTFICRITQLDFSNRTVENMFKADIEEMYRVYGIDEISGGDAE